MKSYKLALASFLLVVFCFVLSGNPGANGEQKGDKNVCFRWAFGAIVGAENDRKLVVITRNTALKTGDQFKMFVELQNKCFAYVIYHSAQGDVSMLFPYNVQQFTRDYETSKGYYIPKGDRWFELDENVGRETFYLLASAQRLIELEVLFRKYTFADSVRKQGITKQILTEIRKIKRRHRKFTTFAERPVPIRGDRRMAGSLIDFKKEEVPDIAPLAVEISANNFFSRTFTIDHR